MIVGEDTYALWRGHLMVINVLNNNQFWSAISLFPKSSALCWHKSLCLLQQAYYSQNYAGIINSSLPAVLNYLVIYSSIDTNNTDLTWPDLTWPDVTWPDLTWCDLTWPEMTYWTKIVVHVYTIVIIVPWSKLSGQVRSGQVRSGQVSDWSQHFPSAQALIIVGVVTC